MALWGTKAERNAVVVQQMLEAEGIDASVRTVQRAVEDERRQAHAAAVATVRFETAPGRQMQVDFGEKKLVVAGQLVKVFLLVAVLSHSRRLFVKAFLNQRGDDWREGIAAAFRRFRGVPLEVLGDMDGRGGSPRPRHDARAPNRPLRTGRRSRPAATAAAPNSSPHSTAPSSVANDGLVDVDTVRYGVPHARVREHVEVELGEDSVRIFRGADLVAAHLRSREPHARVVDHAHWDGLWRRPDPPLRWQPC